MDETIDEFIKVNHNHLLKSAISIVNKNGGYDDPYELLNYSVLQLLEHHNRDEIVSSGFGVFWLIRVMTNSIYSSTSPYHKTIRPYNFTPINSDYEYITTDIQARENLLNNIESILNEIEKKDAAGWYMVNLFKLWVDKRNFYEIARETNIPRMSITRAVKNCKEILIEELKKRNLKYEF